MRWRDFFHLTRTGHTENAEMDFKKAIVLTPSVIPCRVLAPGAWNLPVRATVSFHLTRTGHTENAEMDFKKAIVDIFQLVRGAWYLAPMCGGHRFILYF